MNGVDAITLGSLRVAGCTYEWAGSPPTLSLRGNAESSAADDLIGLFRRLHDECVRTGVRDVRIDLRDLEFMSSSCFKSFVSWVLQIEELSAGARYAVVLVQSPAHHWQERSLHALAAMGPDVISIEVGE
jgi:hypothetical protein